MIGLMMMNRPAAAGAGSGGNNNLSALTMSIGSLSPGFASGTTGYTEDVVNGVTSVSVTPTAANAGAVITVNGQVVSSGSASGQVSLAVGANAIAVVVDGGSGTKTYTVTVTRAAAGHNAPPNIGSDFVTRGSPVDGSVLLTNPNSVAMTVSFGVWNITSGPAGQFSWVTVFSVSIGPGNSALMTSHAAGRGTTQTYAGFAGGTWQCGSDSGLLQANWTQPGSFGTANSVFSVSQA